MDRMKRPLTTQQALRRLLRAIREEPRVPENLVHAVRVYQDWQKVRKILSERRNV